MESIQSTNESIKLRKLVIIPAYNESASIVNTVNDIKKNAPDFDYVVINDHSKDNTLQVCKDAGLNVIDLPLNLGIGGAVQTGYLYACQNGYDIAGRAECGRGSSRCRRCWISCQRCDPGACGTWLQQYRSGESRKESYIDRRNDNRRYFEGKFKIFIKGAGYGKTSDFNGII